MTRKRKTDNKTPKENKSKNNRKNSHIHHRPKKKENKNAEDCKVKHIGR